MKRSSFMRACILALAALGLASPAAPTAAPTVSAAAPPLLRTAVRSADGNGYSATFTFPEAAQVTLTRQVASGQPLDFTRLVLPDSASDNTEQGIGSPEVPYYRRIVAVPPGTTAISVTYDTPNVRDQQSNVLLYPIQELPMDEGPDDFKDKPFQYDAQAYINRAYIPSSDELVTTTPLGKVRDLQLYALDIAVGQYSAGLKELILFSDITVSLRFEGDKSFDGKFIDSAALNPFEDQASNTYAGVINYEAVVQNPRLTVFQPRICFGSEFLIITPPALRTAADTLRSWKIDKGISTVVVETGSASGQAGTTKEQIQQYIRNRFSTCAIRLSYVLLLGDAEHIPPFYRGSTGTDLDYSLMDNADILPDLALGRIPVDTLAQAQVVVNKIVKYEKNPPFNMAFYRNASIASFFQCCQTGGGVAAGTDMRWFIETSELVRNAMLAKGYTVQRIYTTNTDYASAAVADTTPRRYYNGTSLPAELAPASGFSWNGSTADIVSAINAGRFLVLHRDHGYSGGWADPGFTTSSLDSLTNGSLTPVVFSVNCASGYFDNETDGSGNTGVYFVEKMLRMEGGAVGVLGDTRNSPTVQNNTLTRGFFDAIWPSTLPSYGGTTSIKRLGDILNYAKTYMVSEHGIGNSNVQFELAAWHVYGDPTMEIRTSNPYILTLPISAVIKVKEPGRWVVNYDQEGATITALQDGLPIGRAKVVDGVADITFLNTPEDGKEITLSASGADTIATPLYQGDRAFLPIVTN